MTTEPQPRCHETVYGPGSFSGYSCSKPAKVQDDRGRWWCSVHSPGAVAKRRAKQQEKWDAATAKLQEARAETRRRFKVVDVDNPELAVYLEPVQADRSYYRIVTDSQAVVL